MKCIVVGSGPAGVSAAKALLENNHSVIMIDAGLELPEENQKVAATLQKIKPSKWEFREKNTSKLPKKKLFGSDHMYKTPGFFIKNKKSDSQASYAKGGFSTIWGTAMLPYERKEMESWPISLEKYYKEVLSFVPLSGTVDGLANRFPLYCEPQEIKISSQISGLLKKWERNFPSGSFGQSRVAIQAYPKKDKNGCVYCNLCMSGCPYNLLYSSVWTLTELKKNNNFEYKKGVVVRVGEKKNAFVELADGSSISAKKVFLAAGVYSSTHIMLRSLKKEEVNILDSEYFIVPALAKKGESYQTAVSQAFLEWNDNKLGNVHLQFYPTSPLIERAVESKLGFLYPLVRPLLKPFVSRMIVIQGFLHSNVSGSMRARSNSTGLSVEGFPERSSRRIVRSLFKNCFRLGFLPLPFTEYGLPGKGFHSGGSFPMSANPGAEESDVLGRCGFKNVHLVDSSVFPSISATTITLAEMANAYRIAKEAT